MKTGKLFLLWMISLSVCAFSIPTELLSPAYLSTISTASGILAHADLNEDGVEELLISRTYGDVNIMYSDYGSISYDLKESGVYSIRSLAVGDADGNGSKDILVAGTTFGEYTNNLVVIWNAGNQSENDSTVVTTEFVRAQSACFADVDRDGDDDIVAIMEVSSSEVLLMLFEYTDNKSWNLHELETLPTGTGYWISSGYLDDDDYLDFALGAQSLSLGTPDIFGYINQLNHTFSRVTILENQHSSAGKISDLDLDRDGDLFIGNKWLKNNGNQVFSEEDITGGGSKPSGAVDVGDINNDGYPDLMASDDIIDYYVHVWQSYGPGLWNRIFIDGTWQNNNGVALMDFDNDGFRDAVHINDSEHKLYWSRNRGNYVFEADTLRTFTGLQQFRVFDMDNDDDLDLVAIAELMNDQSKIQVYENMGYGLLADRYSRTSSNAGNPNLLEVGQMDGDHLADIVVFTSGVLRLYKQTDLNTFSVSVIDAIADDVKEILLTDFDKDGHTDLLARFFDTDRTLMWYKNDGTGSFTKSPLVTGIRTPITVFDYDQNGANDVLTRHWNSAITTLYLHQNDGSEIFTKRFITGSNVLAADGLTIHDMDGDDDPDILVASSDSGMVSWLENLGDTDNNGAWEWSLHTVFDDAGWNFADRQDLNQDGKPDLLINHSVGGDLEWSANVGANDYPLRNLIGENIHGNVIIADFNGDSWPDIFAKSNDEIVWYKNRFGVEPAKAPEEPPTRIRQLKMVAENVRFSGQLGPRTLVWHSSNPQETLLQLFDAQGNEIQHSLSRGDFQIVVQTEKLQGIVFWRAVSAEGIDAGSFVAEME